tara:strand:- start:1196 stop:1483 length:288 start_codon:yes stop_codon:yes gene_type:complete
MRKNFDPSLLQTKTAAKMILIIKDLNYIVSLLKKHADNKQLEKIDRIRIDVKSVLKEHHLALNSLKHFAHKKHSEQLNYMFSKGHHDRYKLSESD